MALLCGRNSGKNTCVMESNRNDSGGGYGDWWFGTAKESGGNAPVAEASNGKSEVVERADSDLHIRPFVSDSERMEGGAISERRRKFRKPIEGRTCICRVCKTEFVGIKWHRKGKLRFTLDFTRKLCSDVCKREFYRTDQERKDKISAAFTGAKHPLWRGGLAAVNSHSRRGQGWERIAERVRSRDGFKCRECGMSQEANGKKLSVHHRKPYHDFETSNEANQLNNLISACVHCHGKLEAKDGRSKQMVLGFRNRSGHKGYRRGDGVNTSKLSDNQVMQIRKRADSGEVLARLAEEFDVNPGSIGNIVSGKTWRHLPMAKTRGQKRVGRNGNERGSEMPWAILSESIVLKIKQRLADGIKKIVIARELGVSKFLVYNIAYNNSWKHVTL